MPFSCGTTFSIKSISDLIGTRSKVLAFKSCVTFFRLMICAYSMGSLFPFRLMSSTRPLQCDFGTREQRTCTLVAPFHWRTMPVLSTAIVFSISLMVFALLLMFLLCQARGCTFVTPRMKMKSQEREDSDALYVRGEFKKYVSLGFVNFVCSCRSGKQGEGQECQLLNHVKRTASRTTIS